MSTRSVIQFRSGTNVQAKVYRHFDGYPDTMLGDLDRFFTDVEAQTKDTRFNDASYLAAKFVVWQAGEYARAEAKYSNGDKPVRPLNFLGVGVICGNNPGDIDYLFTVQASHNSRPVVTWQPARDGEGRGPERTGIAAQVQQEA